MGNNLEGAQRALSAETKWHLLWWRVWSALHDVQYLRGMRGSALTQQSSRGKSGNRTGVITEYSDVMP